MATKTHVNPKKQAIGKRIAEARKSLGLTQLDLANELSVTSGAVSQYETGRALPERELFKAMAAILKKTEEWLLTGDDPNEVRTAQTNIEEKILVLARRLSPADQQKVALILEALQPDAKNGTQIKTSTIGSRDDG